MVSEWLLKFCTDYGNSLVQLLIMFEFSTLCLLIKRAMTSVLLAISLVLQLNLETKPVNLIVIKLSLENIKATNSLYTSSDEMKIQRYCF